MCSKFKKKKEKNMKKILSITAALVLAAGSMAFAQDAEEVKPEFKFTGSVNTGMSVSFDDSKLSLYNDFLGAKSRIDLNLAYTYGNVGAKGRLRFNMGKELNGTAETKYEFNDDETTIKTDAKGNNLMKTSLSRGFADPFLNYGYVWADLLDGKLTTQAGYLFTSPITSSFFMNDFNQIGVSLQFVPVEGLTLVANAYVPEKKASADIDWAKYWNSGMNYGASYSADNFDVMVAYGAALMWEESNALWAEVGYTPVDQLSLRAEADFYGLGEDDFSWEASASVDFTPFDALNVNLFATYGSFYGEILDVELDSSYSVDDKFTVHGSAGFALDKNDLANFGFGGKAGVTYAMGNKSKVDLTYSYLQSLFADNAYNVTFAGKGNRLSLSYGLNF